MNILIGISGAYLAYHITETFINLIYRKYINYKSRMSLIQERALLGYSNKEKKKKEKGKFTIEVPEKLRETLIMSGIHLRPEEFLGLWVGLTIILVIIAIILNKGAIFKIGALIAGIILPPIVISKKREQQLERFDVQLGETIMIISNSLRGGFTFEQSLAAVSKDLPDPIGSEFRKIVREIELGEKLETTMGEVAEKMESEDMKLMNTAIAIQRQVGGNLADVLDNIGETIRERITMKKNIKTLTSQGEISGKVIAVLPVILIVMISLVNPEYMEPMFNTTLGYVLLGLSAFLEITGYIIIKKLINIEM